MKKRCDKRGISRAASAALCVLICAGLFFGCAPDKDPADLGVALREEIMTAYYEEMHADLSSAEEEWYDESAVVFEAYYGTFGGCAVFSLHDGNFGYTQAIVEVVVGGVYICTNPDGESNPLVYRADGAEGERILSLSAAYEGGFLQKSDLRQIARCMAGQEQDAQTEMYSLTVGTGASLLLAPLREEAPAGARVTFRTEILMDAEIVAYLNGERLPSYTAVQEGENYVAWEFSFSMPAQDSVVDLRIEDGFLL